MSHNAVVEGLEALRVRVEQTWLHGAWIWGAKATLLGVIWGLARPSKILKINFSLFVDFRYVGRQFCNSIPHSIVKYLKLSIHCRNALGVLCMMFEVLLITESASLKANTQFLLHDSDRQS